MSRHQGNSGPKIHLKQCDAVSFIEDVKPLGYASGEADPGPFCVLGHDASNSGYENARCPYEGQRASGLQLRGTPIPRSCSHNDNSNIVLLCANWQVFCHHLPQLS